MKDFGVWQCDLQNITNIGPKRVLLLKKMGINTVGELLYYFPREYDDRSQIKISSQYQHGEQAVLRGIVSGREERRPRRGLTITRVFVDDGAGGFVAVWYNQPFIKRQFPVGTGILVTGKVTIFRNEIQIQVKDYEVVTADSLISPGGIIPIYSLTEGVTQRMIRMLMKKALFEWGKKVEEFIPQEILTRYVLPEIEPALVAMHFPDSVREQKMARRRLVFEELFLQQVTIAMQRKKVKSLPKGYPYSEDGNQEEKFFKILPFQLTSEQRKAWGEIREEMRGKIPMNRLLQGDVGSGKTVVCALAMLKAVDGGCQAALMAPTEILAEQHHVTIQKYFSPLGIRVERFTGGLKKKERDALLERIKTGQTGVIVGTHALIQEDVNFKKLALIVIDEQHRFGVKHRALLRQKGKNPDVLVMTATPIPRTLAMTLYGELDVSIIRELPPGRRPVKTILCSNDQSDLVYREIKSEVLQGRQAYVVCPLVEESEKMDLQAAAAVRDYLAGGILCSFRVALLHGGMKSSEKETVMSQFHQGLVDVLVSTTVIEVGVDVPNASVMAVVDAHRFGIAQLHQLRGRVGRGCQTSKCYLISDARSAEALARLEAVRTISDGFVLAEKDLELRGPGEFSGTQQWGDLPYKVADPVLDGKAFAFAMEEARRLVGQDPDLQAEEHQQLSREIAIRFPDIHFSTVG